MSEAAIRLRLSAPKTKRAKRALKNKAPKFVEDPKKQLLLRGMKSSPVTNEIMKDLHMLKAPFSTHFHRRNEKRPFEDLSSVSFLCEKNDCSLFCFASNSKKRPHNLIFGRLFDYQLLDMFEFGVDASTYQSVSSFTSITDSESARPSDKSFSLRSKPALLFQGEAFSNDPALKQLKGFWVDYFGGEVLRQLNVITLDHVLVFTAMNINGDEGESDGGDAMVFVRHYRVEYRASTHSKLPFVHLSEIGPAMDLTLRRFEGGNDEVRAQAGAAAKESVAVLRRKPKTKNVTLSKVLRERKGRIHIDIKDQNLRKLKVKKMKALRDRDRSKNHSKHGEPKKKKNSNNKKNRIAMGQKPFNAKYSSK